MADSVATNEQAVAGDTAAPARGRSSGSAASKRPLVSAATPSSPQSAALYAAGDASKRPSRERRLPAAAAAAAAAAERLKQEADDNIRASLLAYDGLCYVCLEPHCTHEPGGIDCPCSAKITPDMDDFRLSAPATRSAQSGLKARGRAQLPTAMDEKAVKARRLLYLSEYKKRRLALVNAAKESCTAYLALLQQPVVGSGPLGAFTFYEEISIDFAMRLDQFLTPEQLARAPGTVNASALQKFAKLVKAAGLASLHAARTPAEDAMKDFVALRCRLQYSGHAEAVHSLMAAVQQKERIKYGFIAEVAALADDASLLDIVGAVRQAAAPKRGRPPKLSVAVGSGIEIAMNWVDGGYTVEAMVARAAYDTRRINVSQKETQSDVLAGSALIFKGVPSLLELRQFRPRNRPLQISHASTARLHALHTPQSHVSSHVRPLQAVPDELGS